MSKSEEDIYRGLNYDLINHYNQGVSDERNRIIELLETQKAEDAGQEDWESVAIWDGIINFIKGSSK